MQTTSAEYRALLAAGASKQIRAKIAGVTYGQDKIISATTTAAVMEKAATIGNCVAKTLQLVLWNVGEIPRMAKIQMEFRLTDGQTNSAWYPKGTFFIDTRETDVTSGVLTISAFDPMLKAEQSFTQSGEQGSWPRLDRNIVNDIASRIGVTVDSRTTAVLTSNYSIPYPGYGEGAYTMREMLGYIGALYGGNWIITDENKLRLIGYWDIPEETNYLVTQNNDKIVIGGYHILV